MVAAGIVAASMMFALGLLVWALSKAHTASQTALQAQQEQAMRVIADLCQRIQAPEVAVVDHQINSAPVPMPRAVSLDDDAGFHAARATPEELADLMAAEELAA